MSGSSARAFVTDLRRHVDDWYADRIGYEMLCSQQRTTWDAIHAAGPRIEGLVLRELREALPLATEGRGERP